MAGLLADTPTALSWLARAGAAEGVTGGTTVGGGTALGGGTGGSVIITGPLVLAGLAAIVGVAAAVLSSRRAFREWESKEEALVNSKNLQESVTRAIHQQWQNGIITDEEYLNYLSTGVLVIQPRPLRQTSEVKEDAANRDIRATNSINSASPAEQAAQRGLAAGKPKAPRPPKKKIKAGKVGSKASAAGAREPVVRQYSGDGVPYTLKGLPGDFDAARGVGVYVLKYSAGNVLYVGEGFTLDRIRSHISDPLKTDWFGEIAIVEVRATDVAKSQSLALEQDLIHELKPLYNKDLNPYESAGGSNLSADLQGTTQRTRIFKLTWGKKKPAQSPVRRSRDPRAGR
ncbi:MAG TPA: hypothetical protein VFQ41_24260 [Candidatus Angelobacter sp.]|nr:hypothetical protein [Candidatus Angelobacter sp.]